MTATGKPVIGITMGDAAGIGPEIVLKALTNESLREACRCVIIGNASILRRTAGDFETTFRLTEFGQHADGAVEIVDLHNLPETFPIGVDSAETGRASAQYIEAAVTLWRDGAIDAICTAPISKKALNLAGYDFPGHTEFLAKLTDTQKFAMSFFAGDLRVVLLSTHHSLVNAIAMIKTDAVSDLIRFTNLEMSRLLGREVKIAVAGLNPHASEGGMFGSEEASEITPAIETCQADGIDVSGPYSPDTIFLRAFRGDFDAVIALHHDQATIAVKCLSFGSGVNVTLGLPLIRTSVDHGTAFDIAGRGVADPSSMAAAIRVAAELVSGSPPRAKV